MCMVPDLQIYLLPAGEAAPAQLGPVRPKAVEFVLLLLVYMVTGNSYMVLPKAV